MYERGLHTMSKTIPKARGIDNRLVDYIDQQCKDGKPPKEILDAVHHKATKGEFGQIGDLVFPTIEQIRNRKKYATRESEQFQQYNRAYKVKEWVEYNLVSTEEKFQSLANDDVFTLGYLDYTYVNSHKKSVECTAFAYTTKDLLRNAVLQVDTVLQPNMCGGNADATFNLLKDNWVLHAFGCRGLQKSLEGPTQFDFQLTHHFRPFAFALAPTENQLVYEFLFKSTSEALLKFFQFVLQFKAFCQDRSPSIANAVHTLWPECSIILCWPHIIRGAIDRGKLVDKGLVETFNLHLTYVHSARSTDQFEILLKLMLQHWIEIGEEEMAATFLKVYGKEPWLNWHVTASGIPGFTANNNVIEAWNRLLKRYIKPGKASIGKHLLEDLPMMMKLLTNELGATNGGPIQNVIPCSPNRHLLDKAIKLISEDSDLSRKGNPIVRNYVPVKKDSKMGIKDYRYDFDGYIFNSTSSLFQGDMDEAMTEKKAKYYCLTLIGTHKEEWKFEDVCEIGLRAHAVRITKATPTTVQPISFPGVDSFECEYKCDCKGWWHSLVCAHVLAAMHLRHDINLLNINAQINKPAIPGRPSNYQPVTYKAQQPSDARELSNRKATNYIGMNVASKVKGRVYEGKIRSHAEKLDYENKPSIVWTAVFNGEEQYDEDIQSSSTPFPRYEDFTYDRMMQAVALFKEQVKIKKRGGKIILD